MHTYVWTRTHTPPRTYARAPACAHTHTYTYGMEEQQQREDAHGTYILRGTRGPVQ